MIPKTEMINDLKDCNVRKRLDLIAYLAIASDP